MSLYVKKVPGGEYIYFQTYRHGKRKEEYLGRKGDPAVLEKAIELFLEHQDYALSEFLSKLARIGYEVPSPDEVRRRLPEAPKITGEPAISRNQIKRITETFERTFPIEISNITMSGEFVELAGKIPRNSLQKLVEEKKKVGKKGRKRG